MNEGLTANATSPTVGDDRARELPGAGLQWMDTRRSDARRRLEHTGIPHRRLENWKYSDLRAVIREEDFSTLRSPGYRFGVTDLAKQVETFDFDPDEPIPAWVEKYFGSVAPSSSMFDASTAYATHVFALRVPAATVVSPAAAFEMTGRGNLRVLMVIEDDGELTLLETPVAGENTLNVGIEIVLGARAKFTHVRSASHLPTAVVTETVAISAARGSVYRGHFMTGGALLSRTELHITLAGEGAQAHLSGAGVLNGTHADVTTHVTHAVPDTQSTQLFKYVAGGKARGVYQGKVSVAPGADGSDSRQTAKGLLLGDRAEIDLKPELEIFADDVKCAHGAAVGDLDVESLFYLKSRGIPEAEARALLMRAFLGDAVDQIADETIRASVWQAVETALERLA